MIEIGLISNLFICPELYIPVIGAVNCLQKGGAQRGKAGSQQFDSSQDRVRAKYGLMAQAGMSFRQILASMTTVPAERFGKPIQLGRIVAGYQADLVVLKNDPAKNFQALTDVQYTVRDGKIIYRASQ